jgi:hypothetical protein
MTCIFYEANCCNGGSQRNVFDMKLDEAKWRYLSFFDWSMQMSLNLSYTQVQWIRAQKVNYCSIKLKFPPIFHSKSSRNRHLIKISDISHVCVPGHYSPNWTTFLTIVVYDKQKTALVDDLLVTWSTLIDCLRGFLLVWSGHLDHPLGQFSYHINSCGACKCLCEFISSCGAQTRLDACVEARRGERLKQNPVCKVPFPESPWNPCLHASGIKELWWGWS